jgi:hypothetical protein
MVYPLAGIVSVALWGVSAGTDQSANTKFIFVRHTP